MCCAVPRAVAVPCTSAGVIAAIYTTSTTSRCHRRGSDTSKYRLIAVWRYGSATSNPFSSCCCSHCINNTQPYTLIKRAHVFVRLNAASCVAVFLVGTSWQARSYTQMGVCRSCWLVVRVCRLAGGHWWNHSVISLSSVEADATRCHRTVEKWWRERLSPVQLVSVNLRLASVSGPSCTPYTDRCVKSSLTSRCCLLDHG